LGDYSAKIKIYIKKHGCCVESVILITCDRKGKKDMLASLLVASGRRGAVAYFPLSIRREKDGGLLI
jgi:hypothetical protein